MSLLERINDDDDMVVVACRLLSLTVRASLRICSRPTSLCFVFWPDGVTDNSLHHRCSVSSNSCIHVECSASFCPFFHISVTIQKSTQERTIRAFIPAILQNLTLRHCDSTFLFRDLEVFGFTSR